MSFPDLLGYELRSTLLRHLIIFVNPSAPAHSTPRLHTTVTGLNQLYCCHYYTVFQLTTFGMRGNALSCIRRSVPSRAVQVSSGGSMRSSVGTPANQMKLNHGVSRGISSTHRKQYVAATTRAALATEISSLRFSAVVSGPEANIPRGWDEGVDDDDGG